MTKEIFSFEEYKTFIDTVSKDPDYKDPHFEDDESSLYDALKDDHHKAYVTTAGVNTTGLYVWDIIPEDKYIEMMVGLSMDGSSFDEMLSFIEENYSGFQLDFVINPRNETFVKILNDRNAKFDEEQQWMVCEGCADDINVSGIIPLSQEYKEQYSKKHSKDVYWTADKVMEADDVFHTFVAVQNNEVIGYIDVTYCHENN